MRSMKKVVLFFLLVSMLIATVQSQDDSSIVISLAVPGFLNEVIRDEIISQFETENPGVHVHVVSYDNIPVYSPSVDIEDYLDNLEAYASAADVLLVVSNVLPVEAARSGYLLDLSPLVNADTSLQVSGFYEVLWDSFQWDNGIWALPGFADVIGLTYDPTAFDTVGLPYPESWWTITDLDRAVRELTQYDAEGNVTVPSLLHLNNYYSLILSLLNHGVYNDTGIDSVPYLDDPQLEDIMTQWAEWEADGLVRVINAITEYAPMRIWPARLMSVASESEMVLLPGGRGGLEVAGLAVSAGTQYPEVAYELTKFITNQPELMTAFYATPARRSLSGMKPEGELSNLNLVPEELQPLVLTALETSFSASDERFAIHIIWGINRMNEESLDARSVLQEAEINILDNLRLTEERRSGLNIIVDNPAVSEVAPSEIALKFGLVSIVAQVPNQDRWEALSENFAVSDSQVGQVEVVLRIPFGGFSIPELAEDFDCFYVNSNIVSGADLTLLRNIDPLLESDPTFDESDIVNGVMIQVQRNNQTWAMPLNIQPQPIWYETTIFEQAGAPFPFEGWTVSDFENVLRTLKIDPKDPAPFVARVYGANHILMLIAAYGGLPLDYRTHPIAINYTDKATVNAIRQVLDLAIDGYLEYETLGGGSTSPGIGRPDDVAMFTRLLNMLVFLGDDVEDDPYRMVTYPQGVDYTGMAFDLGAIYISAQTPYPQACYRFMQAASTDPNLVMEMPARRSVIRSQELAVAQGESATMYYSDLDTLFQQPDMVFFPTVFQLNLNYEQVIGDYLAPLWLYQAFDQYVLEGGDLEAALENAQLMTQSFLSCTANITAFNPALQTAAEHAEHFTDCAIQVDPNMAELFDAGE